MSRTRQPQEPQQAAEDKSEATSVQGIVPSPLLPPESKEKKAEVAMQGDQNPELDRFLQCRARLEFAELMTRRLQVAEEEIEEEEEEEELEREVGGGRRNVERFSGLGGWGDLGGRREGGGGGGQKAGNVAVGINGCGGGDGDGSGKRERSYDLVLSVPQLQPLRQSCAGSMTSRVEAEMDGLTGRIRRLTGEIGEVRKVVEEKREREEEARSVLVFDEKDWDDRGLPDTYFPSSPILSSLYPAKSRRKTGSLPGLLDPGRNWIIRA